MFALVILLATLAYAGPLLPRATPTLPSSSLPAPPSGSSLKYIALGLGTQNYTCAAAGSSPVAKGALANLYDIEALLSSSAASSSGSLISVTNLPCSADYAVNTAQIQQWLKSNKIPGQIGRHYFNAKGIPNFDLSQANPPAYLEATKAAAMPAPTASSPCPDDPQAGTRDSYKDSSAAVPWLQLLADGSGLSKGLTAVYRLETVGGSAPASCPQAGFLEYDYAAEYWFYG